MDASVHQLPVSTTTDTTEMAIWFLWGVENNVSYISCKLVSVTIDLDL